MNKMNNTKLATEQCSAIKMANTDLFPQSQEKRKCQGMIRAILSVIALTAIIALCCQSSKPFSPTNATIVSRNLLSTINTRDLAESAKNTKSLIFKSMQNGIRAMTRNKNATTLLPTDILRRIYEFGTYNKSTTLWSVVARQIYTAAFRRVDGLRREQLVGIIQYMQEVTQQLNKIRLMTEDSLTAVDKELNAKLGWWQQFWACYGCGCNEAATYYNQHIAPINNELSGIRTVVCEMQRLSDKVYVESRAYESRTQYSGGVAVVYNPVTGKAVWNEQYGSCVHGVWNPATQRIEWKTNWEGGVYGVWNPKKGVVEWRDLFHGCVHGVWNPKKGIVEWDSKWEGGVYGVWNPNKGVVEWDSSWLHGHGSHGVWNPKKGIVEWDSKWKGSVVGYFDEREQIVKWVEGWNSGVALIAWKPSQGTYITPSSCFWDWTPPPPP